MLRLTIDGNEIELYENEPVNLSYQFADIQQINASSSSFSQTFRVPLTKKNQDYFGPVNEFGLIPNWDPKTKVDAELSYNTIPVMRGFVQVKAIYVQKGKYADVELVFFGETANLSHDIGDAMLTDLDLASYNHTLNATKIEASWAGTLSSGHIRYGLPDKGQNWTNEDGVENIWSTSDPLEHGDFTPYFRASKLLEEILTDAGYTMESDFFDASTGFEEISDLYLLMNPGNRMPVGTINPNEYTLLVGFQNNTTLSPANSNIYYPITLSDTTPFYDTGSRWVTDTYTAPFRARYKLRLNVLGEMSDTSHEITIAVTVNGIPVWIPIEDEPGGVFNGNFYSYTLSSQGVLLNENDTLRLEYKMNTGGSHTVTFTGAGFGQEKTSLEIVSITFPSSLQTVDVSANMPEMKQIDFVSGLQKMFNLVFIPDRNNAKKLYVEPFNYYMSGGTSKDWTNKIDLSKDITIQPTTDLQSRSYDWTHSNGKDLVNDLVFKNAARVYGRYRVDDPGNDFASGTKEIKSPFAPHVVSYIPQTQFAIHRMLIDTDQESKRILDPLPRLAFWNGQQTGTIDYYNDTSTSVTTLTRYPVFSQYSDFEATVTDEDLSFGPERPFHLIEASPLDTLYYKYWRPFVNQLYSSDARKLTAFFRLTRSELATFEFSDKIYLKDTYWRILSISYDATSEDLAKVELLKVLSDIRDCALIPYDINKANGRIRFTNAAGTVVDQVSPANSICCTKYGYVYDSTNNFCYQPFEQ
jgi:hypothetical protein